MSKVKQQKCLEFIKISAFNPVPAHRKLKGDLLYLSVRLIGGSEFGITVNNGGFFRNDSSEYSTFSPEPSKLGNPCYSYTLVGCLSRLSEEFGKNLEIYINSLLKTEPYFLVPLPQKRFPWVVYELDELKNNQEESQTLQPLYGLDPKGVRDWNEEFQTLKSFPNKTMIDRITRDRHVFKTYNDFVDAATKGAVAIVNGNLTPLNPNEALTSQIFVYNYIFFSFAVDTPLSYRDHSSEENNPSFSQVN